MYKKWLVGGSARANSEEIIFKDSMLPPLHSLTLRSNRLGVPTGVKSEPSSKPKSRPESEPKPSGEISKQSAEQKKPADIYKQAAEYLRMMEMFPDEDYETVYSSGFNVIFRGKEIPLVSWQKMQDVAKLQVHAHSHEQHAGNNASDDEGGGGAQMRSLSDTNPDGQPYLGSLSSQGQGEDDMPAYLMYPSLSEDREKWFAEHMPLKYR